MLGEPAAVAEERRFDDHGTLTATRWGDRVRVRITPTPGWYYNTAFPTKVTVGDAVLGKKNAELHGHVPADDKAAWVEFLAVSAAPEVTAKAVFCNEDGCVGPMTTRATVADGRVAVTKAAKAYLRDVPLEVRGMPNHRVAVAQDPRMGPCLVLVAEFAGPNERRAASPRWRVVHAGTNADGLKPKLQAALKPSTVETIAEIESTLLHVKQRCGGRPPAKAKQPQ